jgi:hypothetical protein
MRSGAPAGNLGDMTRPHPLSDTAQLLAVASAAILVTMILLTAVTGVAQEPFEVVRPLDAYLASLRASAPSLRIILAADALFIAAYAAFFVTFSRAVAAHGTPDLLRLGTTLLLLTAALDAVEDQHLFALARSVELGEEITLTTLRAQHLLSQTKFHVSYVGLVLFGLGLPRRDAVERAFALSVALPVPILGAILWAAPPALDMPLSVARWFGFLGGFAGAILVLRRAPGLNRSSAPALESATGAPA